MGLGRRKASARREPIFDAGPSGRGSAPKRGAGGGSKPPARRKSGRRGGRGGGRSLIGRMAYWAVVLCLWGLISSVGALVWIGAHLPPIQSLEIPKRPPSIQIVGLDGKVIAMRGEMSGTPLTLREMPAYLPQAFIAIEDRRFYSHFGIDPIGIVRAVVANVLHRGLSQGGSTLTQQLAKNLFLTQERTLARKMQEAVLAVWLERKFSKAQILELYLNRVYFGSGAYGVEAASQRYFGKSARKISVAEAAMLAGLVKSPSRLAPTRNPDGAVRRAKIVLAAMAANKFITPATEAVAMAQPAHAIPQASAYSANYVADWIMDVLDDAVGRVEEDLIVETSIDPVLQVVAENSLIDELAQKGAKFGVSQGAIVAMTPDGAVRALVGGRNYAESQYNRAVAAKRQPGSAFKPFVYLTALERGLTPDTIREDKPIAIKGWRPENYDREYFGRVTLTRALANSLNTVSVRLTLEVGPKAVVTTAHRLGIASKLEPNASIGLGTSEVSLIELTGAYAPFANGGMALAPHVIERVRTRTGKILYLRDRQSFGRIVDARYVAMMNTMMHETLVSGTARAAALPGWTAAGKTGTSQDFRDAWFIGYTPHLVTGVWLGNDDGTPTHKTTGGSLPVEIWSRVMQVGHRGVPPASLPGLGGFREFLAPLLPTPSNRPDTPITANERTTDGASMDSWLLNKLLSR